MNSSLMELILYLMIEVSRMRTNLIPMTIYQSVTKKVGSDITKTLMNTI